MARTASSSIDKESLSHNLLGQRLGRKGRDTRERILAATEKLLTSQPDTAISLSAVAREASLGMTTLYLYFTDLQELLLAVLDPIMASAENSYVGHMRMLWPDDTLTENCLKFVEAYYDFWTQHTRILHLRNSYADNNDERMRAHRMASSQPLIALIAKQMESSRDSGPAIVAAMGTVLVTGIERIVTVATDVNLRKFLTDQPSPHVRNLLAAEARLLELGIRDGRAIARSLATP